MPSINFAEVKKLVSMERTLDAIGYRHSVRTGVRLRGPCPVHGSASKTSKTFQVNLHLDKFFCFKCNARGDQLDLYCQVMGCKVYQAAEELCRFAGVPVPIKERNGKK